MHNHSHRTQEELAIVFEKWESMRNEIEQLYLEKNREAIPFMKKAVKELEAILENRDLQPLNYQERIEFVVDKLASHYAFVQLNELYSETKKKAARLFIQQQRR